MDRSLTSVKYVQDINKTQYIKRPKPIIVKSVCQKRIDNIKNKANTLIKYQNTVIKEQSDQMLTMVALLENSGNNSEASNKSAKEYKESGENCAQKSQIMNKNYNYYLKFQMILFIIMIVLMILFFMTR
jgi:predicted nucleic acid-binding Zn ribbon protein